MSSSGPIRVALVEDHGGTRAALIQLLREFEPRVLLVGAFQNAEEARTALPTLDAQVYLVDLQLPVMSGAELIAALSATHPTIRAIALTVFESEEQVIRAIRAGAYGYLLKDEPKQRLVQAIEEAAAGAHPVSSRVAGFLFTHTLRAPAPVSLSTREEELAHALAEGLSYAECATRMGIALGTVQDYVKTLYRKLNVSSKKEVREWVSIYGLKPS